MELIVYLQILQIALAVGDRADLEGKADLEDYRSKVNLCTSACNQLLLHVGRTYH